MNETKEKVRGGIDMAADRAKNVTDQAFGVGQDVKNTLGHVGASVKDEVKSAANTVAGFAGEAKEKVQEWSGEAIDAAKQAGDKVQKWAGGAYESTAGTMKTFGCEATDLVKKYPIQSLLIGFGVGLLLGRAART